MIVVLDYGMGNPASISNMIRKAGGSAQLTSDPDLVSDAKAIVLPGVGAFDNGMKKLTELGLIEVLNHKVHSGNTPFLGICLGMQLLFDKSEEGSSAGLCWLHGQVKRFDFSTVDNRSRLKIPHMGWNLVHPAKDDLVFNGLEKESRFYFVHSYHVSCDDEADILAVTHYGIDFTCAVRKGNMLGVQFHPEKSHRFGLTLFRNFLESAGC